MGFKSEWTIIDRIYYIEMIIRIALLTDLDLQKYHSEARGDWACFIAIVLKYFPNAVVCVVSDSRVYDTD